VKSLEELLREAREAAAASVRLPAAAAPPAATSTIATRVHDYVRAAQSARKLAPPVPIPKPKGMMTVPGLPGLVKAPRHPVAAKALESMSVEDVGRMIAAQGAVREAQRVPFGETIPGEVGKSLLAGTGDILTGVSGFTKMIGAPGLGEPAEAAGKFLQEKFYQELPEFKGWNWKSFGDPKFYTRTFARSVPSTVGLFALSYMTGGAVGGLIGGGTYARAIASVLTGASLNRASESAIEAGDAYNEAQAEGKTEQEADAIGNRVFRNNMGLILSDILEFGMMFLPTGKLPLKMIGSLAGRAAIAGGKLAVTGATEAIEEAFQEKFQKEAAGKPFSWGASDTQQAMALGALAGITMGGGVEAHQTLLEIEAKVIDRVSRENKAKIDAEVKQAVAQGVPRDRALIDALDKLAGTSEGKRLVEDVTREAVAGKPAGKAVTTKLPEVLPGAVQPGQAVTPVPTPTAAPAPPGPSEAAAAPAVPPVEGAPLPWAGGLSLKEAANEFLSTLSQVQEGARAFSTRDAARLGQIAERLREAYGTEKQGEETWYDFLQRTAGREAAAVPTGPTPTPSKAEIVGPGVSTRFHAGDEVEVEVNGKWQRAEVKEVNAKPYPDSGVRYDYRTQVGDTQVFVYERNVRQILAPGAAGGPVTAAFEIGQKVYDRSGKGYTVVGLPSVNFPYIYRVKDAKGQEQHIGNATGQLSATRPRGKPKMLAEILEGQIAQVEEARPAPPAPVAEVPPQVAPTKAGYAETGQARLSAEARARLDEMRATPPQPGERDPFFPVAAEANAKKVQDELILTGMVEIRKHNGGRAVFVSDAGYAAARAARAPAVTTPPGPTRAIPAELAPLAKEALRFKSATDFRTAVAYLRAHGLPEQGGMADWRYSAMKALAKSEAYKTDERAHGFENLEEFWQQATAAVRPAEALGKEFTDPTGKLKVYLDPDEIGVDPDQFQFKATGREGVTRLLKEVKVWDPLKAGAITCWKDEAGKYWVVNGHHRVELAKRLKVPTVEATVLRAEDGVTAGDALAAGALQNISEGRGTALDAGNFFRGRKMTFDELRESGVPLREATAREGMALAQLNEPIFRAVVNDEIPVAVGVTIGQELAQAPGLQNAVLDLYMRERRKGRVITADILLELIRDVQGAGKTVTQAQTLFGEESFIESHALEKAELTDYVKKELRIEKGGFSTIAKAKLAAMFERAGNILKTEENVQYATQAQMALELVGRLAHIQGNPICDALNAFADDLAKAQNKTEVKQAALSEIRKLVEEGKAFEQGYQAGGEPAGAPPIQESATLFGLSPEGAGALFGTGAAPGAGEQNVLRKTVAEINEEHALRLAIEEKFGKPGLVSRTISRGLTRALESIFKTNVAVSDAQVEAVLTATRTPANAVEKAKGAIARTREALKDLFVYEWRVAGHPKFVNDLRRFLGVGRDAQVEALASWKAIVGFMETPQEYSVFRKLVFVQDFLADLDEGVTVPGGLSREQLEKAQTELMAKATDGVKKSLDAHYKVFHAAWQELVRRGKVKPDMMERVHYVTHRVLDYLAEYDSLMPSIGRELKAPYRYYLLGRGGTSKLVDTDYAKVTITHLAKIFVDNATDDFALRIANEYDVLPRLSTEEREKIGEVATGRRYVIDGKTYLGWRYSQIGGPIKPVLFDTIQSLLITGGEEQAARARRVLGEAHLLPIEIAKRLVNLRIVRHAGTIERAVVRATSTWKSWTLGPLGGGIGFQVRNFIGDSLNLYREDPLALLLIPKGIRAAIQWQKGQPGEFAKILELADGQRVLEAGLMRRSGMPFDPVMAQLEPTRHLLQKANLFKGWMKAGEVREIGVRLAKFMADMQRIEKGEMPLVKVFDAKKMQEAGLTPIEIAGKVAREFTVDYNKLTPEGRAVVRDQLLPFSTFYFGNFGNWAAYITRHPLEFLAKFGIPAVAMALWNGLRFPDEEEKLPAWQRLVPHIITGYRDAQGLPIVFTVQSPDYLAGELIGLDHVQDIARKVLSDEMTLSEGAKELAVDILQAPVEDLKRLFNPLATSVVQGAMNWDWFRDRPIVPDDIKDTAEGVKQRAAWVAQQWLNPVGQFMRIAREPTVEGVAKYLKEAPFNILSKKAVGIRVADTDREMIDRFYDLWNRLEGEYALWNRDLEAGKELGAVPDLGTLGMARQIGSSFSELQDAIKLVKRNPDLSQEVREARIRQAYKAMGEVAGALLKVSRELEKAGKP